MITRASPSPQPLYVYRRTRVPGLLLDGTVREGAGDGTLAVHDCDVFDSNYALWLGRPHDEYDQDSDGWPQPSCSAHGSTALRVVPM
jgi:hypothetical protein